MIDAHTHFNHKSIDFVSDYFQTIARNKLDAAVLILNDSTEKREYFAHKDLFEKSLVSIHPVLLFDIHKIKQFEMDINSIVNSNTEYSIKLHPRLTGISSKDFDSIYDALQHYCFRNIVVDSFLYGSNSENNCYIELSIFLAKKFSHKKVIMAHFGGIKVLETMLRTRELKNIYYDSSFSQNYLRDTSVWIDLKYSIIHSPQRVMFGSDMPSYSFFDGKEALHELLGEQEHCLSSNIYDKNARYVYFEKGCEKCDNI